jgi:hypothetical protein
LEAKDLDAKNLEADQDVAGRKEFAEWAQFAPPTACVAVR